MKQFFSVFMLWVISIPLWAGVPLDKYFNYEIVEMNDDFVLYYQLKPEFKDLQGYFGEFSFNVLSTKNQAKVSFNVGAYSRSENGIMDQDITAKYAEVYMIEFEYHLPYKLQQDIRSSKPYTIEIESLTFSYSDGLTLFPDFFDSIKLGLIMDHQPYVEVVVNAKYRNNRRYVFLANLYDSNQKDVMQNRDYYDKPSIILGHYGVSGWNTRNGGVMISASSKPFRQTLEEPRFFDDNQKSRTPILDYLRSKLPYHIQAISLDVEHDIIKNGQLT